MRFLYLFVIGKTIGDCVRIFWGPETYPSEEWIETCDTTGLERFFFPPWLCSCVCVLPRALVRVIQMGNLKTVYFSAAPTTTKRQHFSYMKNLIPQAKPHQIHMFFLAIIPSIVQTLQPLNLMSSPTTQQGPPNFKLVYKPI